MDEDSPVRSSEFPVNGHGEGEQGEVRLADIVPGGILPDDRAHSVVDDERCSRCGKKDDEDVHLILWWGGSGIMWRYCSGCVGWGPEVPS